jgi:hypothetical protein
MDNFKLMIEKYSKLLPVGTSVSYTEAERRAGEFLSASAQITDIRHMLSSEKIKLTSVQIAVYAQEMAKGTAKTVTENKLTAEASEEYTKAREDLELIDNDLSYLKAFYDIFMSAHVFYRQMARGETA